MSITSPQRVPQPATQSDLCDWLRANATVERHAVVPVGGGTALHSGNTLFSDCVHLDTTALRRVIDYPARDMTITVEAGIRIAELTALLASENQRLGIDIPQPALATLGGALASNVSGPRRFGCGTMRDAVIGLSAVDAGGRMFKSGGRVVKNVAGYDLCKMLVGSQGTLAVVSQVTLKLRPRPETSGFLCVPLNSLGAAESLLDRLTSTATRPVAVELFNGSAAAELSTNWPHSSTARCWLCLGFEGMEREVLWQFQAVSDELRTLAASEFITAIGDDATRLWAGLTEFQVVSPQIPAFKATVRPSRVVAFLEQAERLGCSFASHAANGIVFGRLPNSTKTVDAAAAMIHPLRACAVAAGGSLTPFCDDAWKMSLGVFARSSPDVELMRTLKKQLDPAGLLSPGRIFGDI